MGRRGPKPTPTSILRRRGSTLVPRRDDAGEPVYEAIYPPPPESLAVDALEYWEKLHATLSKVPGLVTEADAQLLGMLCQSLADRDRFRAEWERDGAVYEATTDRGGTSRRVNPAYSNYLSAFDRVMKLAQHFGLTPSDRASIAIPQNSTGPSKSDLIKLASTNTEADDAERSPAPE